MDKSYPKVGVGAIVLDKDDRVLLQLRNKPPEVGHWSIPGGRVEFMETVQTAIVRELKEELGIDVVVESLLCVTDHIVPADNAHWVSPAYLVRVVAGEARNLEPESTRHMEWFSISNLPEPLTLTTKSAVEAFRRQYHSGSSQSL
jgi:8-oxo-dGTP diphosphatase